MSVSGRWWSWAAASYVGRTTVIVADRAPPPHNAGDRVNRRSLSRWRLTIAAFSSGRARCISATSSGVSGVGWGRSSRACSLGNEIMAPASSASVFGSMSCQGRPSSICVELRAQCRLLLGGQLGCPQVGQDLGVVLLDHEQRVDVLPLAAVGDHPVDHPADLGGVPLVVVDQEARRGHRRTAPGLRDAHPVDRELGDQRGLELGFGVVEWPLVPLYFALCPFSAGPVLFRVSCP